MTPDEIIRSFGEARPELPRAAMQAAVERWESTAPALLQLLQGYLERPPEEESAREEAEYALLFALYLFGQLHEKRAFAPLCALARRSDDLEAVLGDGITESLAGILINCFDGDLAALQGVIEAQEVDDFVRSEALDAFVYLVADGRLPRAPGESYLRELEKRLRPRGESYVWTTWILSVARFGLADMTPAVERVFKRRWESFRSITLELYRKDLERVLQGVAATELLAEDGIAPAGDAIETLSRWVAFSKGDSPRERERSLARIGAALAGEPEAPRRAPLRPQLGELLRDRYKAVGRNDPCPCGSGKKYKKCCLALPGAS